MPEKVIDFADMIETRLNHLRSLGEQGKLTRDLVTEALGWEAAIEYLDRMRAVRGRSGG